MPPATAARSEGPDEPQLTFRALAIGLILGAVLAVGNLYVALKTGWVMGVSITAAVLGFSTWRIMLRIGVLRSPLGLLETNCIQSAATAAGMSTIGTVTTAVSALLVLSATPGQPGGQHLPPVVLVSWVLSLAVLGLTMAMALRPHLIAQQRLPFPSSRAVAVMLQSLHRRGRETIGQTRALLAGSLVAAALTWLTELRVLPTRLGGVPLLPGQSRVLDVLPARGSTPAGLPLQPSDWTLVLDHKLLMAASGAVVGLRVSLSMLLGALLLVYLVGPAALASGAAPVPGRAWRDIGVWAGTPLLVASGVISVLLSWRQFIRALSPWRAAPSAARQDGGVARCWLLLLAAVAGSVVVILAHRQFHIPWPLGLLALALTFAFCLIAGRAVAETDFAPAGQMGKVMQLGFGFLLPRAPVANLMAANITVGAAMSSVDLLTDLKSGALLGAHPGRQFVAQLLGLLAGTAAVVLGFHLLVPDATALTGAPGQAPPFPAPAAQAWLAVAKVLEGGLDSLHPFARRALVGGLVVGALLAWLEARCPRVRPYLPSPMGLGVGLIMPAQYPLAMALGASAAWLWTRLDRDSAGRLLLPLSSGAIAGESIAGVLAVASNNFLFR